MRFARQAIEFESKRQVELIEKGKKVVRETLHFNPATGVTTPMRDKESAHDYRYFPDPDLPPVKLNEEYIEKIKATLPELPWHLFNSLVEDYGLSDYEAELLTADKETALFFLQMTEETGSYKSAANLLINRVLPYLSEKGLGLSEFPLSTKRLAEFIQLIDEGKLSTSSAYQRLFPEMVLHPEQNASTLAESLNLIQSSDSGFIEKIVEEVLEKNPAKVEEYRSGRKGLLGFFMGEIMKASKGIAEPKSTTDILRKKLDGN